VKREHTKTKDAACQYCDYRAVSSKEVWKHALRMHTEQVIGQQDPSRVHECPKCPRVFYSPAQLRAHDEQAHIKDKKYACNLCDFRTAYPQSVKYHIREVHDRLRPFECPYCDYKAGRKANLELHLRTVHKQQKPPKEQSLPLLQQQE
jgi:KRAB domain-containing zinc finger protein